METENPFSCDLCGKSFKNKRNMNNHKMIHTGEKPYACETCEKTFIRKDKLTDHKRSHTGERPYECDICAKTFTKNQKLTDHKKIHTGEISFTCDACLKTFTRKDQFMNHKRIHSGERPYKCDLCEKTFTVSSSLNNHKKLHYTSEKSHECDICKKKFSTHNNLLKHKRVHTGEKPYACVICEKTFGTNSDLTRHNKTALHLKMMESQIKNSSHAKTSLEVCGESMKLDEIKEEIKEEEFVEDPSHFSYSFESSSKQEKPYNCDICQKSYSKRSHLSRHCNTAAHLKIKESNNTDFFSTDKIFVDCGETIKVEDIKEEINEEESVDDPLSIQGETTVGESDNIVTQVKREVIEDDSLCFSEIDNSGDGVNNDKLFSHAKTKNKIACEDKNEKIKEEENVEVPLHEIVGKRLFSCDVCREKFTERIVLMMHKDINHSQAIPLSVEDPLPIDNYTGSGVKQEVKEEVKESDEGQGVDDSNLDTDHLVDCSQYPQVQINLAK